MQKMTVKCNEVELDTLLDTGAGPSIMSLVTYEQLGGKKADIQAAPNVDLLAANNSKIPTLGMSPLLDIRIGSHVLPMQFLIATDVPPELILGRDFITLYEVQIDLTAETIRIGNPNASNLRKPQVRMDDAGKTYEARVEEEYTIPPNSMRFIPFYLYLRNANNRSRAMRQLTDLPWEAYAEPVDGSDLQDKGAQIGKAMITVRHGKTYLPIVNANENESIRLLPRESYVRLVPLFTDYVRQDPTPGDDQSVSESLRVINLREKYEQIASGDEKRYPPRPGSILSGATTLSSKSDTPVDPTQTAEAPKFPTRPKVEHLREVLTKEQFGELNLVIDKNKDLFSQNPGDIGHTTLLKHDIELEPGAKPFKEPIRRMGNEKKKKVDEAVRDYLQQGIIKESNSPFASASSTR